MDWIKALKPGDREMSLADYCEVARHDKFELDNNANTDYFAFPCNCCVYRVETQDGPNCGKCAHNSTATLED